MQSQPQPRLAPPPQPGQLPPPQPGQLPPPQPGQLPPLQLGQLPPLQLGQLPPPQLGQLPLFHPAQVPQPSVYSYPAGPQVVVVPASGGSSVKHNYAALTSRTLGIIQITGGVLAFVFQAILTGLGSASMYWGSGFYCGVMFIITGVFGLNAGKYRTKGLIITYMVLAIISAVLTPVIFGATATALVVDRNDLKWVHYDWQLQDNTEWDHFWRSTVAFNSLLLIVAFVELVTLIWGSVLGCKVTCCCQEPQQVSVPIPYGRSQVYMPPTHHQMQVAPPMAPQDQPQASGPQPDVEKQSVPDSPPPEYRRA